MHTATSPLVQYTRALQPHKHSERKWKSKFETKRNQHIKMSSYQTPDTKKEEFRKYLEKSGVIDALTKVLVGLYEEPERPPNAVEYIKRYLGAPAGVDVEALKSENARLKKENAALQEKVEQAANMGKGDE